MHYAILNNESYYRSAIVIRFPTREKRDDWIGLSVDRDIKAISQKEARRHFKNLHEINLIEGIEYIEPVIFPDSKIHFY